MAQQQWRINGFSGRSYLIGLYHGDQSGHLVIYCNNNILLTDFKVEESKDYSFFLDQEMFQIRLEKENGVFSYELIHNEELDTPHNRTKAENKRTDRWRIIGLICATVFFVIMISAIFNKRGKQRSEFERILSNGGGSSTTILISEQNGQLIAQYPAEGQLYTKKLFPSDTINTFGFPIFPGQEIGGRYYPEDPKILRLDWNRPSPELLDQYFLLTVAKYEHLHPELAPQHARCHVRIAQEMKGLEGLATLYGQGRSASYRFNEYDYLKFVRSSEFRKEIRECL